MSRIVVRAKQKARSWKSAHKIHGGRIAAQLNELFDALRPEGRPAVDYGAVIDDLAYALERARIRLERADWAHLAEVANDRRLRELRDGATGRLQRTLVNISDTVDATYGDGAGEEVLGLGVGLRPEPEIMFDVGSRVAGIFADPEFRFPRKSLNGVDLDSEELKREIEEPLDELGEALEALADEQKKYDATLKAKQDALDEYLKTLSWCSNILRDYFGFAGEEKLAEHIRPKTRKKSKDGKPSEDQQGDDRTQKEEEESEDSGSDDDAVVEVDENGDEIRVVDPAELPSPAAAKPSTKQAG